MGTKAKQVRQFVTYMFELDGYHFKVWEAADGGYYVDEVTTGGADVAADSTGWAHNMAAAHGLMEAKVAVKDMSYWLPTTAGCAEGNCVEPEMCEVHRGN